MVVSKKFRRFGFLLFLPALVAAQSVNDLSNALNDLHNHVAGASILSSSQLNTQQAAVIANNALFESNGGTTGCSG